MLIGICLYLISWLIAFAYTGLSVANGFLPQWLELLKVVLMCIVIGGVGGCVYCLRAVYLHKCVSNDWNERWYSWYFLRPIISATFGGISYIFLRAGLFVFESATKPDASEIGFYALAFIAGFNVDKFIKKIEEIAEVVWGVEKSRASKDFPKEE